MIPVLIIGYGNPLRSDDGIGRQVAQTLLNEWPPQDVRVEAAHQLLPEMADWIAEAEYVIFIDACWNSIPGRIRSRAVVPEPLRTASMTHHFSPQGLLADAEHLFHHTAEAMLVSVGGASFEHGEGLSPSVAAALENILLLVKKLTKSRLQKATSRKVKIHA